METVAIILCVIICILSFIYSSKKRIKEDKLTLIKNQEIRIRNEELKIQNDKVISELEINKEKLKDIQNEQYCYQNQLNTLQKDIDNAFKIIENTDKSYDQHKQMAEDAFKNYCENLDNDYKNKDAQYNELINKMVQAYSNKQQELLKETRIINAELEKIKASRAAAIEAQLREKQIEENKDDFRLNLDGKSLGDIKILKSIQSQISNPIVIDKIIWSNYYQPLAKAKFPKIIGKAECCGIYKLTSLVTGEIYIGQSKTVCDRWKDHCKNALGVGTSTARNKLYSAIKRDGLENYTFEVLEECSIKDLDEKEKYYISLYDSYNFGLNATQGNN